MKRILLISLISIIITNGLVIYAQKESGSFPPADPSFNLPSLTEEQKSKIKDLRISHMKEIQPLRNEMKELKAQYKTLSETPDPDISAISKNIDAQTNLMNRIMKSNASQQQAIRKNLNDEQKLIFDRKPGNFNRIDFQRERRFGPIQGPGYNQGPGYQFRRPGSFYPYMR